MDRTKRFLVAVFEDVTSIGVDDRLEALKLMRKAEARKITPQSIRSTTSEKTRELYRDLEIAGRRMRLDKAGLWPPPSKDWADDLLSDDYVAPTDRSLDEVFEG